MKLLLWSGLTSVALTLATVPAHANVTVTTTGTYDSANNANAVDRNANGDALAATGLTDVSGFTTAVAAAYAANNGGVIDFDTPNGGTTMVSGQSGAVVATFGGAANKMLALTVTTTNATSGNANKFDLRSSTAGITTISGSFFLIPNSAGDSSITLSLGGITGTGAGANEHVSQVGFTLLDRNTITGTPVVTANYSNGTTGTLGSAGFTAATANEDTFYSFVAPTGAYITSVSVAFNAGVADARLTIDDFGFVTDVPEPSALAGSVLALVTFAGGWYRRATARRVS